MKRSLLSLIFAAIVPLLAGCSSFNREWRTALRQPIPTDNISGPWDGHWVSDKNGHNGRLRCLITADSANTHRAQYRANYFKILRFSYSVPFQFQTTETNYTFTGEADLGKLAGGLYSYEGRATPSNYFSTYKSKYDHGRFEMKRPGIAQ